MKTDRPSNPERPSDEDFLKELAALDEALRRPDEPERSQVGPDRSRPPDRTTSAEMTVAQMRARDRMKPPDLGYEEHHDLILPPADMVVSRRPDDAIEWPRPRRPLFAWMVVALSGGLLAGGAFGLWLATSEFGGGMPAERVARASTTKGPAASRAARPSARSRAAAPNAAARGPVGGASAARGAASIASLTSPTALTALPSASLPPSPSPAPTSDWIAAAAPTVMTELIAPAPAIASHAGIPSASIVPMPLVAAPTSHVSPAMSIAAADQAAIEATLRRYEQAYERLDAKAASAVWPKVDRRALSRAFAGLASQALDMRGCEVVVRAGARTATASCHGSAEYVRKVGDTRVQVEPRQWMFTLNKTEGEWRIEEVDGRSQQR